MKRSFISPSYVLIYWIKYYINILNTIYIACVYAQKNDHDLITLI